MLKLNSTNVVRVRTPVSIFTRAARRRDVEILALIPVYNGESHLEKCLKSLEKAVDSVIALDDGSTDRTGEILRDHGIVQRITTYPPKPIEDWDEAWTRRTLYELAADSHPRWVLCFDADEEMEETFGRYRQSLLEQPATIRGYVFPRVGICNGKITRPIYLHRMYRYAERYSFHNKRIHCRAIPLEIDVEELRVVNVRIFHHSASPQDKRARYEKYRRVDPFCEYQASYENLLTLDPQYDISPLGSSLELGLAYEDGFQRPLVGRRFFQRAALDDVRAELMRMREAVSSLTSALETFSRLRLKTFVLIDRDRSLYRAQYSYDDNLCFLLSEREAWFIESYWTRKDLFDILAQFAFTFGVGFPLSLDSLGNIAQSLHSKGILRVFGGESLPEPPFKIGS